jgi:hypothetical protein
MVAGATGGPDQPIRGALRAPARIACVRSEHELTQPPRVRGVPLERGPWPRRSASDNACTSRIAKHACHDHRMPFWRQLTEAGTAWIGSSTMSPGARTRGHRRAYGMSPGTAVRARSQLGSRAGRCGPSAWTWASKRRLGLGARQPVGVLLGVHEAEATLDLAAAVAPLRDPGVAVGAGAPNERPAAVPGAPR